MMTVQDLWVISPEIAMAVLALVVISVDLVTRSMAKVSAVALVGLAAPLIFTLNLWYGWFGSPGGGTGLFGAVDADRFSLFFNFLFITITAGTDPALAVNSSSLRITSFTGRPVFIASATA